MKIYTRLNEIGQQKFENFLRENLKNPDRLTEGGIDVFHSEIDFSAGDPESLRDVAHFELHGRYAASGNPATISFDAADCDSETIDD